MLKCFIYFLCLLSKKVQWSLHGGKCGLCGDDYGDPVPREHEDGGFYGRGVITKSYKSGSFIPVSVYITANHFGYFIYDLCNLSAEKQESDECFFRNKLQIIDGKDYYKLPNGSTGWFNTTIKLPPGLTCNHCVLRWTYNTGWLTGFLNFKQIKNSFNLF